MVDFLQRMCDKNQMINVNKMWKLIFCQKAIVLMILIK